VWSWKNTLLFAGLLALSLVATATPKASATPGFVTQSGTQLMLDGQPYRFVGTNRYNLLTLGGFPYRGCGDWWTESDIVSWLDELKLHTNSNVVRFWAFQLFTADATDFSRLDFLLDEAGERDIKVIPVLENNWVNCTSGGEKYDTWYATGYKGPYGSYSLAYHDPASPPATPTDYVGKMVDRYKDDTRIVMWQLMNEAQIRTSTGPCGDAQTLRDFASDVTAYIKAIDPNHLVSFGTIGSGQCGASGAEYQDLHAISSVDLCEYHDYQAEAAIPGDQWNGLQVRIDQCSALNKPLFVGEAGILACGYSGGPPCSHPTCTVATCYTQQERADFFDAKMDAFLNSNAGVGYLIWTYRDNYLSGQQDTDPTLRFTATDPLTNVVYAYTPNQPDSDGDGRGDRIDNCPTVPNPSQANLVHPATVAGDACEDPDADSVFDISDNCPDWYNPAQNLPPWPVLAGDPDCDGFTTDVENSVGTNPSLHCGTNANPADFNNDSAFSGADLSTVAAAIGQAVPPAPARKDITPDPPDGAITGADLSAVAGRIGRNCAGP